MDSSLPAHFSELAAVDLIGLGLVGVLVILGLWRGLWWQVLRLVGVVAAVIVARVFSPETAAWISEQWPDLEGRLAHGVAWFGIFLLALGAASMLGPRWVYRGRVFLIFLHQMDLAVLPDL